MGEEGGGQRRRMKVVEDENEDEKLYMKRCSVGSGGEDDGRNQCKNEWGEGGGR